MSIIELETPWCFNAMSLEQHEVEKLQKYFVDEGNHQCDWQNSDYCGITSDGLSDYFCSSEHFDENEDSDNVTVYTIEQLRAIIAEHLAKQPVEPKSVTQFVVGKWYKWFQKDHGKTHKGKCATLYDSHVEMKPWICHSSEYVESGMFNLRDAEFIELIEDLSEIQDLLPDGHEDKWVKTAPNYWSVGTYVVALLNKAISIHSWYKGDIAKIHTKDHITLLTDNSGWACNNTDEEAGRVKWFATLTEAEEFAKTLKEPVYLDDKGRPLKKFKVSSWYTNPKYTSRKLSNGNSVCFFKVQSCVRKGSSRDYYYNQFKFDEVADKYWNKEIASMGQANTDFDQEMVEVFPVVKSERYLATMKFFEQLREPERSEAIANYDEDYSGCIPSTLSEALNSGFSWTLCTQHHAYWYGIAKAIRENTYFKESEFLVFGKYKVGDIVVSTFGEPYLYKIAEGSTKDCLRAVEGGMSDCSESWRLATPEEVKVYNKGFRNVANIEPKDYKESVHCTTQEEWDFVLSKFNPSELTSENFKEEGKQSTITIKNTNDSCIGCYADVEYDTKEGYTILTFKQWCEKYGHSYEVVPEYVECVSSKTHHYKEGKIYTWPDTITEECKPNKPDILKGGVWEFKPSTKEAYDKQQEKLKMEELLSEAKRRYPAGTKFKCLVSNNIVHEVEDLSLFKIQLDTIFYKNQVVYDGTKWTEIVKEKPWIAQVGDWVYVLEDYQGNSCLLKGDIVRCDRLTEKGNTHFSTNRKVPGGPGSCLLPKHYRKATQEEIDSVTMTAKAEAVGKVTITGTPNGDYSFAVDPVWTADNWYVEVSSQEEADAVIDAAAKMYGKPCCKRMSYTSSWKYVSFCSESEDIRLLSEQYLSKHAKTRPITDFIQKSSIITEDVHKSWVEKQVDAIMAGEYVHKMQEASLQGAKMLDKLHQQTQQDELVIYKPKRLIL